MQIVWILGIIGLVVVYVLFSTIKVARAAKLTHTIKPPRQKMEARPLDMQHQIRTRYLERLDDLTGINEEDPRMDYGVQALPFFVAAFEKENDPSRRATLVRIIWQFRDVAALPALSVALRDPHKKVWVDALDGIVTIKGEQGLAVLEDARTFFTASPHASEQLEWIDEAISQMKLSETRSQIDRS